MFLYAAASADDGPHPIYELLTKTANPLVKGRNLPRDGKALGDAVGEMQGDDGVRTWWWIGVAVSVSVLMRLRMLSTPINADEGGYLAIARAWGHGRGLYSDVWVDRPQGLLGLFRMWDWLSRGHTSSIRVMAMLFGALLVVSTALVVWQLFGHVAARWAALICAVLSATPVLEGYMANGELLSGAVATTGLAVSVIGLGKPRIGRWMFAASLLAGVALSLKQSGFDGLMAMLLWLAIRAATEPDQRRRSLRAALWLGGGAATAIASCSRMPLRSAGNGGGGRSAATGPAPSAC